MRQVKEEKKEELTTEKAKELLAKEQQENQTKCKQVISETLEKYNCILDVTVVLKAGQVIPQIDIVSK